MTQFSFINDKPTFLSDLISDVFPVTFLRNNVQNYM